MKKEQKAVAKNLLKEQNVLEKIIIREKEEKKRDLINQRTIKWEEARIYALDKCKTVKEFEEVSKELERCVAPH